MLVSVLGPLEKVGALLYSRAPGRAKWLHSQCLQNSRQDPRCLFWGQGAEVLSIQ